MQPLLAMFVCLAFFTMTWPTNASEQIQVNGFEAYFEFVGLDENNDGLADYFDVDGDGVIDGPPLGILCNEIRPSYLNIILEPPITDEGYLLSSSNEPQGWEILLPGTIKYAANCIDIETIVSPSLTIGLGATDRSITINYELEGDYSDWSVVGIDVNNDGLAEIIDEDNNGRFDDPIALGCDPIFLFQAKIIMDPPAEERDYSFGINNNLLALNFGPPDSIVLYPTCQFSGQFFNPEIIVSDGANQRAVIVPFFIQD